MRNVKCKKCANFKQEWCEKVLDSPEPELVRDCEYYRTLTNGEKIRNMTDEETGKLFSSYAHCYGCPAEAKHCTIRCEEEDVKKFG